MTKKRETVDPSLDMTILFLGILILPFLLWQLELALPYPALIEESLKLLVVVWLMGKVKKGVIYWILLAGGLFGVSESLLFLQNANIYGSLSLWWGRWLLTVPMHMLSIFIIYRLGRRNRIGLVFGWILAIFLHYGFNAWIGLR